ncbi:MAG: hypothetical protein NT093_03850 [Candidatus Moranbacteria bacterium]|nr:hypothetical protein [Candidatus Moranbacteria bacterium]
MSSIIIIIYFVLVIILLAFGAAIVFHLLYYKINRHVSGVMSLIYVIGAVLLIIPNFILFRQINWGQLFSGFKL